MIRVLVADDHPLLRQGLKQVLEQEPDLGEVGEAADSEQALEQIDQKKWDVVILDIAMPGRGGLDVLREIRRRDPVLPVLVLSVHSEDEFAIRAIKAGAKGYLSKVNQTTEHMQVVSDVLTDKNHMSPSLAAALANAL